MPQSPHRRRHRSQHRSTSRPSRPANWPLLILVAFLLGVISARTQLGIVAALTAGIVLCIVAYFSLSCLAGRLAASIRNAISLHSAHNDLGTFMRTNESFRAARRSVSRHAP